MTDLVWTKTPPTQPGWYFWRWEKTVRVFHVSERKNGRLGYGVCEGSACLNFGTPGEEWAGPLPEPKEAK